MQPNQVLDLGAKFNDYQITYPFAFTDNPVVSISDYISFFTKKNCAFGIVRPPLPYEIEILLKYKDNIYNSFQTFVQNSSSLITVIQVTRNFHLFLYWMYNDIVNDVVFHAEVLTSTMTDVPIWLRENAEYEIRGSKKLGFINAN